MAAHNDKLAWARTAAKLSALRTWEDKGTPASLEYAMLMGKLPNVQPALYVFSVQGTAASGDRLFSVEDYVTVTSREDGTPITGHATDEQIELAQNKRRGLGALSGLSVWRSETT